MLANFVNCAIGEAMTVLLPSLQILYAVDQVFYRGIRDWSCGMLARPVLCYHLLPSSYQPCVIWQWVTTPSISFMWLQAQNRWNSLLEISFRKSPSLNIFKRLPKTQHHLVWAVRFEPWNAIDINYLTLDLSSSHIQMAATRRRHSALSFASSSASSQVKSICQRSRLMISTHFFLGRPGFPL